MKLFATTLTAACLSVFMTGCAGSAQADNQAGVQAIKDNETQWNKDFEARDVEKMVAHYTQDATLMTPGAPPVTGKDAIAAVMKMMMSDNGLTLKFQATRVEAMGDLGFSQGTYTMTMTNPATKALSADNGAYVTVYKKQPDGSWKAVSDIASSSVPPVAAK